MTTLPTYDQIRELPAQLVRSVPLEFIDDNGHMNIGRYLELGGTALWGRCQREFGMPEDYIATRGMSTFTVEHHLMYLSEMLEGEEASVHVRLIARTDKALHSVSLIVNESQRRLACVMEATLVHMNMTERRPTPFPDDVTVLLDAALERDNDLAWPAPLSGSMGVRRSA
ncbi:thioesterase family protein [Aeromicrobium sp. A1-2]|uniref:thioesterase family protein n=1 Tax=Aeromicrobium sp. A1-2 TaxID=2107713 RepID=UPI0013C36A9E|nr:thioesterase family protein [Aeromicrobium sp. A1-2]